MGRVCSKCFSNVGNYEEKEEKKIKKESVKLIL